VIRIKKNVFEDIISHSIKDAPVEACGYLGSENGIILESYPMENIDHNGEHFSFNPVEQFSVLKKARQSGRKLSAVYHCHPSGPAMPSKEDIRKAFDPDIIYIIVSLAGPAPVINAFRIQNGAVENERIEVLE